MFKRHLKLEVRGKEDRLYEFHVEENAPLGEAYDVLHTMLHFVAKQIKDAVPKVEEPAEEETQECVESCEE